MLNPGVLSLLCTQPLFDDVPVVRPWLSGPRLSFTSFVYHTSADSDGRWFLGMPSGSFRGGTLQE